MGTGIHGGFGKGTRGARDATPVTLPKNEAQLMHIFSDRQGHLSNTPQSRKMLQDLANSKTYYIGTDKYGNSWNAKICGDGSQIWVRYRDGIINEGGRNVAPRTWNEETGFNNNPVKRRKKL